MQSDARFAALPDNAIFIERAERLGQSFHARRCAGVKEIRRVAPQELPEAPAVPRERFCGKV
jgi:hypothetical protein